MKNLSVNPLIFLILAFPSFSQELHTGKYGLSYIQNRESYEESVRKDSSKRMVNLKSMIPNLSLDLRYAGKNNFVGRRMYPQNTYHTFLRLPAARALKKVQEALNGQGYGLKIYDAYRPYSVTETFWELVHDERYVADPRKGSGHNRGIAVDLTVIDLGTGKEIAMPTGFDNFTDSAHQDFMQLPEEMIRNRNLLKETMQKFGFQPFPTEWWHFSLPDAERYEVLDLSFKDLEN